MLDMEACPKVSAVVRDRLLLPAWTAVRANEARKAEWSEFDLEAGVWTIPEERMKMRREHCVPLPRQCLEMLRKRKESRGDSPYIFSSSRSETGYVNETAALTAIRRMGWTKEEMCVHGFRGMYSTLIHESQEWSNEVIKQQLSHQKENAIEGAYDHSEYMEPRRKMMQRYADWLDQLKEEARQAQNADAGGEGPSGDGTADGDETA